MPDSFVQYWQLQRRGITAPTIRGIGQERRPDEVWMLAVSLRGRLSPLLRDLGFDPSRDVWVRDLPHQHVFRLTQRSNEEERRQGAEERRKGQLRWIEEAGRQ
jgi:hypothetical protein